MQVDNPPNNMKHYEAERLLRYAKHPVNVNYTERQVHDAYRRWAHCPDKDRTEEWDVYCDVRDGKPINTNATIREFLKKCNGGRPAL